jgi:hypothetical protein
LIILNGIYTHRNFPQFWQILGEVSTSQQSLRIHSSYRSLELLGACRLSPEQMCQLIDSCPDLEELSFAGIRDSNIVVRHALLSLDKLRVLTCPGLESVLLELAGAEKTILKLTKVHLCAYHFVQASFDVSQVCISEMLPAIEEFSAEGFNDVSPFLKFNNVTKLLLKGMMCEIMIETYCTRLTYLNIYICDSQIDLSMIGYYCINLEDLFVQSTEIVSQCAYALGPEHFSKLNVVFLQPYVESASRLIPVSSSVMYKMLTAPNLKHFTSYFILLSHTLLCNLIAEAEEGRLVFAKLGYLDIDVIELPGDLAIQLVCAAPKLKEVSLQRMLEADLDQFLAFITTHLPKLVCSMV